MTRALLPALLVLPLVGVGCAVEPPLPLEENPERASLVVAEPLAAPVAVAPVRASYLGGPALRWPGLSERGPQRSARPAEVSRRLPPREYQDERIAVDTGALQARLAQVLRWGLRSDQVSALPAGAARAGDAEAERRALCAAAEQSGGELLVQVDLEEARAAWVERDGLVWWADFLLFYGPGILPVVFIPDEVFEVALRARLDVIDARSGRAVLSRQLVARHERALNDAERGWSLSGFLFLYPYTLGEDDFEDVRTALLPHALEDLEAQVVATLGRELPAALASPESRELLVAGDPADARLYALVVGANGPQSDALDRPRPLIRAEDDARAVATLLEGPGGAHEVTRLIGSALRARTVVDAAGAAAARMRGSDRLVIYFAGFGRTDSDGAPELVLSDGGRLPLANLAARIAAAVPEGAEVTFVLDCSFGGAGGRTYPGGARPAAPYLGALVAHPGWQVLAACGPNEVALEFETLPQGLFTTWLVHAAQGPADADGDGELTTAELADHLQRWVPAEAKERVGTAQTPLLVGDGRANLVLHGPRPGPFPAPPFPEAPAPAADAAPAQDGVPEIPAWR